MSLKHGEKISSKQVEISTSQEMDEVKFASLCNNIVWAYCGFNTPNLPSMTERVKVKDKGRDCEWDIEVIDSDFKRDKRIVGTGWNVFQYKWRDIINSNRKGIISELKRNLKGELKEVWKKNNRIPVNYVLFTNIDLGMEDKKVLKESILDGFGEFKDSIIINIMGAAEIAVSLNDIPHIRTSFFCSSEFSSHEREMATHSKKNDYRANVDFIGRESVISELQNYISDNKIKAIIVSGGPEVGKTRTILEALRNRAADVIIPLDEASIEIKDLPALESKNSDTILYIDNLPNEKVENFIKKVLCVDRMKIILSLSTHKDVQYINYGIDERIRNIRIDPLSERESRELLKKASPKLDFNLASWIIDQSGGYPGILLIAAKQGKSLRREYITFKEQISKGILNKIKQQFDNETIDFLKMISLFSSVNVKDKKSEEIRIISKIYSGVELESGKINEFIDVLENAGIIKTSGSFVTVLLPFLANWLAKSMFGNERRKISEFILTLLGSLEIGAVKRFFQRLSFIDIEHTKPFFDWLFSNQGFFSDIFSALQNHHLFGVSAICEPLRTSEFIFSSLRSLSYEEILEINKHYYIEGEWNERRNLVFALEELLRHRCAAKSAMISLALLAEAENENDIRNNATGVFCDSFSPYNFQLPLPFYERINLLK